MTLLWLLIIISLIHRIYENKKKRKMRNIQHPWKYLIQEIRDRDWTQKHFSLLLWKKVSEVNELIKWKRNITIQWDLLLSKVLWSPEKSWMNRQIDYDYSIAKENFDNSKIKKTKAIQKVANPAVKKISKQTKNTRHEGIFKNF